MPQCPPNNRTGVQQVDIKTSIRFLEQKSRLFKGSICQVLRAQGWCSTGCPVTHIEAPGAGAGGGPGQGRRQTVRSLIHLTLSWVWLWSRVGDVLTLSQPLGYSSKVETAKGNSARFRVVRTLMKN